MWIGSEVSRLERLSIQSFLSNGHSFHLFVYDVPKGIPDGTTIVDANDIVRREDIFKGEYCDGTFGSLAAFSDFFRHKLLYELGGWWVDLDVVCIKPFNFSEPYVFAQENNKGKPPNPTCGVAKVQKKSQIAKYCWDKACSYQDKAKIKFSEIGPDLFLETIYKYRKYHYLKNWRVFMPIGWWEIEKLIEPNKFIRLHQDEEIYSIHFYNERWRFMGYDKNSSYHPDSIYEQLKRYYRDSITGISNI
jgi:hypothetical protein